MNVSRMTLYKYGIVATLLKSGEDLDLTVLFNQKMASRYSEKIGATLICNITNATQQ